MTRLLTGGLIAAALLAGCGGGQTADDGSPPATPTLQIDPSSVYDDSDTTGSEPADTAGADPADTIGPDTTGADPPDATGSDDPDTSDQPVGSQSDADRWVDERQDPVIDDANQNNMDAVDGWSP